MDTKEFLDESIKIIIEKKKEQFREREIRRDMLNQVIKKTIARIKLLQVQLVVEKRERTALGHYEDCGNFYVEQVMRTETSISELINQKITLEKWRKKLQF